jgi:hypothetical protein
MKRFNLVATVLGLMLLGACVPSVHPFFTEKDIALDPRLEGEWLSKDNEPQTWKFEKTEAGYKLLVTEKNNKRGDFEAHLFKLKDHMFLDLVTTDCKFGDDVSDLVAVSMFPGHLLFRVTRLEPGLELAACDYDWLAKYLDENPDSLAHHKESKRLLLTARTVDLQAFVLKHLAEGELFGEPCRMVRKTTISPESRTLRTNAPNDSTSR